MFQNDHANKQLVTFKADDKRKTTRQHLFLPKAYSGSPTVSLYTPWTDAEVLSHLTAGWGQDTISDPELERALKVRLDFMIFCGLSLHAAVPDEKTHCRFRNALVKGGVTASFWPKSAARSKTTGCEVP